MSVLSSFSSSEVLARGSIRDADVMALRKAYYEDGLVSQDEADKLFEINDKCPVQDPAWAPFFIEALTDFVVNQAEPEGYVTADNAEWLIMRVSAEGQVSSKVELDLLVSVLDQARWAPVSLIEFCLAQVKRAVLDGSGPLRSDNETPAGAISEGEVELLRRMVYAFGGDGCTAITRKEAEVLFDINDALTIADEDGAWTELFVKAIANVVMAASGYAVPSREEALRREAWLDDREDLLPGALIKGMAEAGLKGVIGSYRDQTPEERALSRLERQRLEIVTNEVITEGEASWLAERIGRDGEMNETELALWDYLKENAPEVHPELSEAIARLSRAA